LSSTTIADSAAVQLASGDFVEFDLYVTFRTVGASGTFVVSGSVTSSISGTETETGVSVGSTSLDTTTAETLKVTSLASAQSSGNVIALQEYEVDLERAGGAGTIVYAEEAINNSSNAGSSPMSGVTNAAFIRVSVP
jgi:hypothetical protein